MEELHKLVAEEGEGQWEAKAERFFEVTGRPRKPNALRCRWRDFGKEEAEREPEKQQPQSQQRSQQHSAAEAGRRQSQALSQEPPGRPRRDKGEFFCVECTAHDQWLFCLEAEGEDPHRRPARLLCSGSVNPCLAFPIRNLSAD